MTQEKELLIKDLCGRLPYGVKVKIYNHWRDDYEDETLTLENYAKLINTFSVKDIKPYLFPLSSMTEEQREELVSKHLGYYQIFEGIRRFFFERGCEVYEWLNEHHFDYRGLIEKGLAIDATELNIY